MFVLADAYSFTCSSQSAPTGCELPASTKHNTTAWELYHQQLGYGEVLDLHRSVGSPKVSFDNVSVFKWFDYTNTSTKTRHRVSFDDPQTLLRKYQAVLELGVAGIGAWTVAATQRAASSDTLATAHAMWSAVSSALRESRAG